MEDISSQTDLIVIEVGGENRIDSRLIARGIGVEHESFVKGLRTYRAELEELGILRFQIGVIRGRGQPPQYAMLNEDQCILASNLSRNTKEVVAFKLKLTKTFSAYRKIVAEMNTSTGFTNKLLIDRIRLFNERNNITCRKYCIFQEVAWDFFSAEMRGSTLPEGAVPDGSVGRRWHDYVVAQQYDLSLIEDYPHHYPDKRATRNAYLYPIEWLPDFKIWFQEIYLPVWFPIYLRKTLKIPGPEVRQILTAFRVAEQIEG